MNPLYLEEGEIWETLVQLRTILSLQDSFALERELGPWIIGYVLEMIEVSRKEKKVERHFLCLLIKLGLSLLNSMLCECHPRI